ncbi:MAG TPA: hypothetical protein VFG69_18595, partial [Nannocystaceae bacterium]|nr:hypothetical protein [Nannocystaceae bacterium]
MGLALRRLLYVLLAATAACEEPTRTRLVDPALTDLRLVGLGPDVLLPGTVLVVSGESFVDDPWGTSRLRLRGATTTDEGEQSLDLELPAEFVDDTTMTATIDEVAFAALGGDGADFSGLADIRVTSAVDGKVYRTTPIDLELTLRSSLAPRIDSMPTSGVIFPNEPLAFVGSGLLLEGEGATIAIVEGCFRTGGVDPCAPVGPVEVPVVTPDPFDRTRGVFAFAPEIAGITPGGFEGTVRLRNLHAGGETLDSPPLDLAYDMQAPIVYGASTDTASLGQYVTITGGGFVGAGDGDTLLGFTGTFVSDATGDGIDVDEVLLPEFVDGHTVRYVVSEDDALGQVIDVRYESGTFTGTLTPRIAWQSSEIAGDPSPIVFRLTPVRQIVYVNFLPAYVESLRAFGLRAVDQRIRERVLQVIARDYETIGLEVRAEPPTDFAYFAQVDIGGPDPNGLGLLGYDNTQGKDTENLRLYDRIGGVNALTQQDGYPGYGGVFIESLLGYSQHPNGLAIVLSPEERFDALFDPFRPDVGGQPIVSADLSESDVPMLGSGDDCPAPGDDRELQIACAVFALANMIGTTVSHEIGHSLGLADPYGPDFHDAGEEPDRLMDGDRPFAER